VPLFGFNAGIELGQLVVLALAAVVLGGLDRLLAAVRRSGAASVHRSRVPAVSALVVAIAAEMAVACRPW
jgi:hypothetical protein